MNQLFCTPEKVIRNGRIREPRMKPPPLKLKLRGDAGLLRVLPVRCGDEIIRNVRMKTNRMISQPWDFGLSPEIWGNASEILDRHKVG
jgi:hypothetical protein